jgi:CrcB protein
MYHLLAIAVGGSMGALARFGLSTMIQQATSDTFPWGTLAINLSGSFLIGVLVEVFDVSLVPTAWRSFLTIGFLAAFTTFSTYTLETVNLFRDGETRLALFNVLMSNIGGVACVVAGIYAARFLVRTLP